LAGLEERADEAQEIIEQLGDAAQGASQVPQEIDDGLHTPLFTAMTLSADLP
jgi:hypothetical protein